MGLAPGAGAASWDAADDSGADRIEPTGNEVVFIDTGVADWKTLAEGVDPTAEVILVDRTGDGVQVMADVLAGRSGVDAVHVVSHGRAGSFQFGSTWVNASNLDDYAEEFVTIRQSLATGADLLLYGCYVGADGAGQTFIERLSHATGADVAASETLTGATEKGGDWELEVAVGDVRSSTVPDVLASSNFEHTLQLTLQNSTQVVFDSTVEYVGDGEVLRLGNGGYIAFYNGGSSDAFIFDANGNKTGEFTAEDHIDTTFSDWELIPLESGAFALAWTMTTGGTNDGVRLRILDSDFNLIVGTTQVEQVTSGTQQLPNLASLGTAGGNDRFVITYNQQGGTQKGVYRVYDFDGTSLNTVVGETDFPTTATSTQNRKDVGSMGNGNFVVVHRLGTGDYQADVVSGTGTTIHQGINLSPATDPSGAGSREKVIGFGNGAFAAIIQLEPTDTASRKDVVVFVDDTGSLVNTVDLATVGNSTSTPHISVTQAGNLLASYNIDEDGDGTTDTTYYTIYNQSGGQIAAPATDIFVEGDSSYPDFLGGAFAQPDGKVIAYYDNWNEETFETDSFFAIYTDEPPNTAPTLTNAVSDFSVDEDASNSTFDLTSIFSDSEDADSDLTFSVVSNSNSALVDASVDNAADQLTLDYQADQNGSADITIRAQDSGGLTVDDVFTVTVNNLAPVFNSSNSASFAENGTGTALDVNADNGGDGSDDSGVSYAITGGTDSGAFGIDASTGELTFNSAPDFETPTDSDGQNDYVVDITADDGASSNNTTTQTITVTVTDVNEPPTVSLGAPSGSLDENNSPPNALTTITITDDALGSNTLALSGTDAGSFQINGADLEFTATADFESKSSYDVTVEVDDSNVGADPDDSQSFSLSINDVNEAPTVASAIADVNVNEDASDVTIDLTSVFSDPEQAAGDLNFAVDNNTNSGLVSASIDNSTDALTLSFAQDASGSATLTVSATDDAAQSVTDQFDVTVTAQNDAPTISAISDQTIAEDGALSPVAFTIGDTETAASSLTVTATSDDQPLVPDANITLGGSDANRTIEITPASDANGTATLTVTVDDGGASNNTTSTSFTLTVTAVPDLALTDGRDGASYDAPAATPGTDDNPVGRFQLGTDQSTTLSAVTITNYAPTPTGVTAITLWTSSDDTFDGAGTDTEVASIGYDDTATFSGLGAAVSTGGIYVFVTVDLDAGAEGTYEPALMSENALSFGSGGLSTVNGTGTSTFSDAFLSSGSAALPVELMRFEAQTAPSDAVTLTWQTASETNNAGFEVQRRAGSDGAFEPIGFQAGAGTSTEPRSYRFTDAQLPYAADSLTYRLKQLDADGSAAYSRAVALTRSAARAVELLAPYPNPTRHQATVRFALPDGAEGAARLELFDLLGRRIHTQNITGSGRQETQLDVSGLSSGLYFLRLTAAGQTRTQRLTLVR